MERICTVINPVLSTGTTTCPEPWLAEANPERVAMKRQQMDQVPYLLDRRRPATVLDALREVCLPRRCRLLAAHVRTNHVHAVVGRMFDPRKSCMLSSPTRAAT